MTTFESLQIITSAEFIDFLKKFNIKLKLNYNLKPEAFIARTRVYKNNKCYIDCNCNIIFEEVKLKKFFSNPYYKYINKYKWIYCIYHEIGHYIRICSGKMNYEKYNKQVKLALKHKRPYNNIYEEYLANKFAVKMCRKVFEE